MLSNHFQRTGIRHALQKDYRHTVNCQPTLHLVKPVGKNRCGSGDDGIEICFMLERAEVDVGEFVRALAHITAL